MGAEMCGLVLAVVLILILSVCCWLQKILQKSCFPEAKKQTIKKTKPKGQTMPDIEVICN